MPDNNNQKSRLELNDKINEYLELPWKFDYQENRDSVEEEPYILAVVKNVLCFSHADTQEEAETQILDALKTHIIAYLEENREQELYASFLKNQNAP